MLFRPGDVWTTYYCQTNSAIMKKGVGGVAKPGR
jgi:hypothetical protein